MNENNPNMCPVCGFDMDTPPTDYAICSCCGNEFGYDDVGRSHEELRSLWISDGMNWWADVQTAPDNWNPNRQLNNLLRTLGVGGAAASDIPSRD